MQEKVTINGTSYCVGLSCFYGGVMWFCRICIQYRKSSTMLFWTKKELESQIRTIQNRIIKRELLSMLCKVHGRAVCYAR